ncbi:MAG: GNAT family N-acetyltransferase [Bacillota bacterium]
MNSRTGTKARRRRDTKGEKERGWWPVYRIPSFLPGRLELSRGSRGDYEKLERFHYRPKRPATWAEVWTVRYVAEDGEARVVAVAVVSYPTLASYQREGALGLGRLSGRQRIRFVNRHIRTISRVAVHPTFRSLGLAGTLVKCVLHHGQTRYVEAMAVMGRAHPFFERAGMRRILADRRREDGPVYYLWERRKRREEDWGYPVCDYHVGRNGKMPSR